MSSQNAASNLSDAVRLDITNKDLFGRKVESAILYDALERISRGQGKPELVLVGGRSGTGKSCLVNATLQSRTLDEKRGFFIKGKFDQFNDGADIYSALLEALNELCEIIDSREDRSAIVERITEGMGHDVFQLASFVPGIQTLFPGWKENLSLDDGDRTDSYYDRFKTLCCTLIHVVAQIHSPIVLFVDDLQWSDAGSLKLIQSLLSSEEQLSGLLIVGTYRDDEVNDGHLLSTTVKKIATTDIRIAKVILGCLSETSVNKLLSFATELSLNETAPLSQLIHCKTLGNCFFIHQFLEMLQDDHLLAFSFINYKWEWDLNEIAARTNVSQNVVDLVVDRIGKLDLMSKQIFQIAGCLGRQFTTDILSHIACSLQNESKVEADGILTAEESLRKLLSMRLFEKSKADWLKFSHDRIQQAAEAWLYDQQEKMAFQFQIGKILMSILESGNAKHKDWLFFTAIDQLNKGTQLMESKHEKMEAANLNRLAAKKARKRSAFLPAAAYEDAAIMLLGKDAWNENPDTTMELYEAAATSYLACGRSERSFDIAEVMLQHTSDTRNILRAQVIQLGAIEQQRRFDDAKELGMTMLRSLGERFPRKPNQLHVLVGFLKIKRLLEKYTDEELLNLPVMTDENEIMISKMNGRVARILFFAKKKDVVPLLWFRQIEKSLAFGMSTISCAAFCNYSSLLGHLNDSKGADRIGKLSMSMCEKYGNKSIVPMVHLSYYYVSHHWRHPVLTSIDPLMNAYTLAMKVGDVQLALVCAASSCSTYMCCGLKLEYVEKDLRKFVAIMEDYNLKLATDVTIPVYQLILNLTGSDHPQNPIELTGQAMDEASFIQGLKDTGNVFGEFTTSIMKLRACIFLGVDPEDAFLEYRRIRSRHFAKELRAHFGARQDDVYGALAAISMFKRSGKQWYRRYARRIVRKMETHVEKGAMNCVHMLLLLQAETMTLTNFSKVPTLKAAARQEVKRAFDKAINSAKRSGFCQDAGLANERAAMFHEDFDDKYAGYYWQEAYDRYIDWGAGRKLAQMMELHVCLRRQGRSSTQSSTLSSGGRMNARSRYNETASRQHKFLTFMNNTSKREECCDDSSGR